MTVGWGDGPQRWAIEFGNENRVDPHRLHPIDDQRALALHYTNLGAAALRNGDAPGALGALATAVRVDEAAGAAWVNLGVALRRRGQVEDAEKAYRRAIAVEPEVLPGWANLYALLRSVDRDRDAASLLSDVASRPHRDPGCRSRSATAVSTRRREDGNGSTIRRTTSRSRRRTPWRIGPYATATFRRCAGCTAEAIDPHEPRLIQVRRLAATAGEHGGSAPCPRVSPGVRSRGRRAERLEHLLVAP